MGTIRPVAVDQLAKGVHVVGAPGLHKFCVSPGPFPSGGHTQ
jgi:hypothetical protein